MSTTETEPTTAADPASPSEAVQQAEAKRRPNAGKFAVLKEIKTVEELTELMAKGEVEIFAVVARNVEARSGTKAIESIAVTDDEVRTGRYAGVPMASWQPRNVRQVVHMTLE